ncbi:MAG: T9SS type A sorting domain-containing protein [Bacteroidales bacterium]|nr:MAG: T9SS type A sorting domain-containing protein [Bacteroidales bacterium]
MKKFAFFLIVVSFAAINSSYATRYYVNWAAFGNNDGSSWTDALISIKTAIDSASAGDTIFVSAGFYPASASLDKNEYIGLKQGVVIFGSFIGNEDPITQAVIDSRDFVSNPSLLMGDLFLDDAGGGNMEDNTYHVVVGKGTETESIDTTTVLNGFLIYGGNAIGDTDSTSVGGGIYLSATGGGKCNPKLERLVLFGNYAKEGGGMMLYAGANSECSPVLNSVLLRGNYADGGAGLYCKAVGGVCNPTLDIVDFNYNVLSGVYPGKGAAMLNYAENTTSAAECSPVINISEISHHEGDIDGGAVYNMAGGINEGTCNPVFINMSFYKNGTYGIINEIKNGTCMPQLTNVILWNESINNKGGAVPDIDHCLIEGSNGSGPGWNNDLGNDGGNNIDADPLWADPDGRVFGLLAGSPALGAGDMIEGINIGSYQGTAVGEPAKIIIVGSLDNFGDVALGQTSAEQSYAVKGTNLTGNIDIEAPEGFAITTTSGDYSGDTTSITLTQSGGTVDSTQIYVRFSPSIEKIYLTVLIHNSTGASDKFLIVEGNCYDGPEISITGILEDFDSVVVNDYSAEQSFTVEGYDLTSDISVNAPDGFEISLTSGDYTGNTEMIDLAPVNNNVPPTLIYVRFAPEMAKHYSDNILVRSTDAEAKQVFVQGEGYETGSITLSGTLTDFGTVLTGQFSQEQSFAVEGKDLLEDILVTAPDGFQITLTSGDYSGNTDSIALTVVADSVELTTIYARFAPTEMKSYSDNIMISSAGVETIYLDVTGMGATKPVLSEIIDAVGCDGGAIDDSQVNISDADVNTVTLDALSSNTDLMPVAGINITGTGGTRTIVLDPNEGQTGNSEITIIATNSQGMKDSITFLLIVNPNPVIEDFTVIDETTGNDGEITITATSAAGGLQYALNAGAYQSSATFGGLTQGSYNISVMDANGCVAQDVAEVDKITGIYDLSVLGLSLYPIPSDGILYIDNSDKMAAVYTIRIYNSIGELLYLTGNRDIKYIDLTGFSKGLYIFKLYTGDKIYIEKFTIE